VFPVEATSPVSELCRLIGMAPHESNPPGPTLAEAPNAERPFPPSWARALLWDARTCEVAAEIRAESAGESIRAQWARLPLVSACLSPATPWLHAAMASDVATYLCSHRCVFVGGGAGLWGVWSPCHCSCFSSCLVQLG
jgi:hypothetical protein